MDNRVVKKRLNPWERDTEDNEEFYSEYFCSLFFVL